MPSTYTSTLQLERQATGENTDTWGPKVNTVFDQIDAAMVGVGVHTHDDTNTFTIYASYGTGYSAGFSLGPAFIIQGTLTAARTVYLAGTVPIANRPVLVYNRTTGGFAITVRADVGGGVGVTIPVGQAKLVYRYADGVVTEIREIGAAVSSGPNFALTGSGPPTASATTVGDHYTNTSTSPPKVYFAYRTGFGSGDWILLNDGTSGGGGGSGYGVSYGNNYGV